MSADRVAGGPRGPARGEPAEPIPSITSVPPPLGEDQAKRMRIYLIQMGVRVGCIVGAVAVGRGWLLWVFIAAAVVLPYTAVIFVNAGRDQSRYDTSPVMFDAAGRPVLDVPRHGSIAGREAGGEPGPADGPPDPAGHRTQRGRAADSSI